MLKIKHTLPKILLYLSLIIASMVLLSCRKESPGTPGGSPSSSPSSGGTHSEGALGTTCSITVYAGNDLEIVKELFPLVHEIENRLSVKKEESEISRINSAAGRNPVKVSGETLEIIRRGLRYSGESGGGFDITVEPLVSLWGIGTEKAGVPGGMEIEGALSLVDYREVVVNEKDSMVYLPKPGMGIDLGAIAKGWAIDRIISALKDRGVSRVLLNFGGNVFTAGKKEDGSLWRIGVQDPWDPKGNYIGIIQTFDTAVATSGKYERFFIEGEKRYHHLLDTKAGWPIENGVASVTIVSPDATEADALSTMVFALGIPEGYALLLRNPTAEGIIVLEDRRVYVTPGLRESFNLIDDSYTFAELE